MDCGRGVASTEGGCGCDGSWLHDCVAKSAQETRVRRRAATGAAVCWSEQRGGQAGQFTPRGALRLVIIRSQGEPARALDRRSDTGVRARQRTLHLLPEIAPAAHSKSAWRFLAQAALQRRVKRLAECFNVCARGSMRHGCCRGETVSCFCRAVPYFSLLGKNKEDSGNTAEAFPVVNQSSGVPAEGRPLRLGGCI